MQEVTRRQAVITGLALLLLFALVLTAWTGRQAVLVQAELGQAAQWLQGAVIVLDPGHGGMDPGAVVGSTREKELTLQISLKLKRILEEHGATVHLTRDRDMDLGGPIRQELTRRVDLVRQVKPDLFLSLHVNKDSCYCWGAQSFFQRNGLPAGKTLALSLQSQLRKLTPTTRSALSGNYYVLRTSPAPSAIVEVGFLTSSKEHQRLIDPAYQETLAVALALGMADYLRSLVPEAEAEGSVGQ